MQRTGTSDSYEKSQKYKQSWIQRAEDRYIEAHGSMPLCACGCGDAVKMNSCGKPQKYAGINHQSRIHDMAELSRSGRKAKHEQDGDIPVEKFREVIERVKRQRNLTWKQLAELAGVHPSTLRAVAYDKRKRYITRRWAVNFFNRCSGMTTASVPTPSQARAMEAQIRRVENRERVLWRDTMLKVGA